jgi:hypothetical protein
MSNEIEPVVNNIIIEHIEEETHVLFSALKADTQPIKAHNIQIDYVSHGQGYEPKCAICNSPHRNLLEQVYLDSGKVINKILFFFKENYNAKLNFSQVKIHLTKHCDFSRVETSGLLSYTKRNDLLDLYKYREYELALIAMLDELDEIKGTPARTLDEKIKRASMIEKLTKQIMTIKEKRDDSTNSLPNVFEVLYELHEVMTNDDDRRIIREKAKELKDKLSE